MQKISKTFPLVCLIFAVIQLTACSNWDRIRINASAIQFPTLTVTATATPSPSSTFTLTPTSSATATSTATKTTTPTITDSPSASLTPSFTPSPTMTPSPTSEFPEVTVSVANAHCRYGPGKAYLHAADLHEGDHGLIWNRDHNGTWLWVRFDKLNYACWVAASVTEIEGDVFSVSAYFPPLPKSTLYGPPQKVMANRDGDQVVVSWERVWMTEDDDRGYLIEARLCQNVYLFDTAVHTNGTSYTFTDQTSCEGESKGKLYTVEKHGYSDPVQIPWP